MTATLSIPGLLSALLLPWFLGSVWMFYLLTKSSRWNYALVISHGYIVGIFLTTLVIRVYASLGLPLHYWTLAAILSALSVVGIILIRKHESKVKIQMRTRSYALWPKIVIALLLSLLVLRYFAVAQELALRPLYAWDSWMNWYPKAAVWYHYNDLVPYISPANWLTQAGHDNGYTLGNYRAWMYPPTVPLIQLWSMLGAENASHSLLYTPWLLVMLMLGLALFGHLRLAGASLTHAVVASYCLLSLPYFNVHTALVGYADIWLAAAFGMAGFSLYEWQQTRHWSFGVLAVFLAFLCVQLKLPGSILGSIVLIVFVASLVSTKRYLMLALGSSAIFFVSLAAIGIDAELPLVGYVSISFTHIDIPYLGSFRIKFHPLKGSLVEALFLSRNWNLLWYLVVCSLLLVILKRTWRKQVSLDVYCGVIALLFLLFTFHMTHLYASAIDFSTVNRAFMYPVPILVFAFFRILAQTPYVPNSSRDSSKA